jgi:hypothetical protein
MSATTVNGCFAVSPIVRGYALRSFVELHTPEQRYTDVATWLQLGPLVEVQKNIRALRSLVKLAVDDVTAIQRIDTQSAKETGHAVKVWDTTAILVHANAAILARLDKALVLVALAATDPAYVELEARAAAEEKQVGLAGLRQIRNAAMALWAESTDAVTGKTLIAGAIPVFEAALVRLLAAEKKEADERGKAASAVFQTLWDAAESAFAESASLPETCPVCTTPIADTAAGSVAAIRRHLTRHLEELADYAAAKKGLDCARAAATKAHTQLVAAIPSLVGLLDDGEAALKADLASYQGAVAGWSQAGAPVSTGIVSAITTLLAGLKQTIAEIEGKQGDHTYIKAKIKIDRLLELRIEHGLALATQRELEKLSDGLITQATKISAEIRKKVQALLDRLQTPMNDIYRMIQGATAAPIRLELPSEDDTNQQRLNLLIDFAKNRTGVQPAGYLSDSQIHSMALALRLAAIKQFNVAAPIIALDDIVTSYDADHRRTIAGLIGTMFGDCQIILTTHDERFFNYLKDQLEQGKHRLQAPRPPWDGCRLCGQNPPSSHQSRLRSRPCMIAWRVSPIGASFRVIDVTVGQVYGYPIIPVVVGLSLNLPFQPPRRMRQLSA